MFNSFIHTILKESLNTELLLHYSRFRSVVARFMLWSMNYLLHSCIALYRYSPIYAILDICDFAIRYFLNLTILCAKCTNLTHRMSNAKSDRDLNCLVSCTTVCEKCIHRPTWKWQMFFLLLSFPYRHTHSCGIGSAASLCVPHLYANAVKETQPSRKNRAAQTNTLRWQERACAHARRFSPSESIVQAGAACIVRQWLYTISTGPPFVQAGSARSSTACAPCSLNRRPQTRKKWSKKSVCLFCLSPSVWSRRLEVANLHLIV